MRSENIFNIFHILLFSDVELSRQFAGADEAGLLKNVNSLKDLK